jgi:hypothetical protein
VSSCRSLLETFSVLALKVPQPRKLLSLRQARVVGPPLVCRTNTCLCLCLLVKEDDSSNLSRRVVVRIHELLPGSACLAHGEHCPNSCHCCCLLSVMLKMFSVCLHCPIGSHWPHVVTNHLKQADVTEELNAQVDRRRFLLLTVLSRAAARAPPRGLLGTQVPPRLLESESAP